MIHSQTLNFFIETLDEDRVSSFGSSLLLLGDQLMDVPNHQGEDARRYLRRAFPFSVVETIDINGAGTYLEDLSSPIEDDNLLGAWDIVADFGTIEHVDGLSQALLNVYDLLAGPGSVAIHCNPETGSWPGHGISYFFRAFWEKYIERFNLELIELDRRPAYHNTNDGWEILVAYKKREDSERPTRRKIGALTRRYIASE